MSQREVAMNANWKHGDILCGSCNAAGAHGVLKPARCATMRSSDVFCVSGSVGRAQGARSGPFLCAEGEKEE